MRVLLDGQPLSIARDSLAEALRAGVEQAASRGRIIIEARADGRPIPDDQLSSPPDTAAGVEQVTLTSAEPRTLVRVTLLDAAEALDGVRVEQAAVAEMLQAGRTDEALEKLTGVMGTWQAVRDVLSRSAEVVSLDLSTLKLPDVDEESSLGPATRALATHLREIKEAVSSEDWSALSDIVAYDLDAQAGVWRRVLTSLAGVVADLPGPAPGMEA